jgi:hypothetical protein
MPDSSISSERYPLGFVAAMLAPAAIACLIGAAAEESLAVALFAFFVALVLAGIHVGIIAIPVFALLHRWWPPAWWLVLPASFLVGAAPVSLLAWPTSPWREWLEVGLAFGGFGLSGGVAFWLVVNRPWRRGSCK